jgi:hypothetical protein
VLVVFIGAYEDSGLQDREEAFEATTKANTGSENRSLCSVPS